MFLFSDGCDAYGSKTDLQKKYASVDSSIDWSASGGRWGGGGIEIPSYTDPLQLKDFPARSYPRGGPHVFSSATVGPIHLSFWIYVTGSVSTDQPLVKFVCAADGTDEAAIQLGSGNKLQGRKLDATASTTAFGSESSVGLSAGGWHHVEIAACYDSVDGFLKVWIDNVLAINFSGNNVSDGDLGTSGVTRIVLYGDTATGSVWYDDVLVWDEYVGKADDLAADHVGAIRIGTLPLNADGSQNDFAPSSSGSDNYAMVDEMAADDDTTYVDGASPDLLDMYRFGTPGFTPAYVLCCVVNARMENPDIGSATAKLAIGTPTVRKFSDAPGLALSGAYQHYQHAFMRHPATGGVFTFPWDTTLEVGVLNVGA